MLPGARAMTGVQRRENTRDGKQTGAEVGERNAGLDRRPLRLARHRHDPRDALRHQIEPAPGRVRPGLAVPGNRRVDEPAVDRAQPIVPQAGPRHRSRPEVLDEHVRGRCEARDDLPPPLVPDVDDNAPLAAVDGVEGGAVGPARAGHAPRGIAAGRLHLDHVRAHVAK